MICFPLEAEAEAVGIFDVELLHAVPGNFGLLDIEAFFAQMPVSAVDVGAAEVDAGVAMCCDPGRIGNLGPFAVVVGGIEHDFRVVGIAEPAPTEFVGRPGGRVLDEREAKDVAVEADRSGHVEDFKQGTKAANIDGHEVPLNWGWVQPPRLRIKSRWLTKTWGIGMAAEDR